MKEKVYNYDAFGDKHQIILARTSYKSNNSIAVLMIEKMPDGSEEDWATLTVNLVDAIVPADSETAYIDTNNLGEDIIRWLSNNRIAVKTAFFGRSGYCTYPLVMFTKGALNSMRRL